MYEVYVDKTLCPVTPSKIKTKINSQNKTITLINDGEINMLKQPGLTDISFDLLLPNMKYPFARYKSGFQNAKYYLDILEELKTEKKSFQFKVIRTLPNGSVLFDTDLKVSLEDYEITDDAKEGFDIVVAVKLKQYKEYGTKTVKVAEENTASVEQKRSTENSPAPSTNQSYTVKSGDCLWNIAKKYYGDGSKYTAIYEANKDKISNPNLIYPGQVLTIPNASTAKSASASGSSSSGSKATTSKPSGSGGSGGSGSSGSNGTTASGTTSKPSSSQQYTLTVTLNPVSIYIGGTLTISYTSPVSLGKPLTITHKGSGSLTLNLAKDSVATFIITTRTGYTYKIRNSSGSWNRGMTSWTYKADKKSGSITIDWEVKK